MEVASSPGSPFAPSPTWRTAHIVFGVVNIVYGALGACLAAAVWLSLALPEGARRHPLAELFGRRPLFALFTHVELATVLLTGAALVAAGIGLLRRLRWAWVATISYGAFGIALAVLHFIISLATMAMPMLLEARWLVGPQKAFVFLVVVEAVGAGCLSAIYPLLILLMLPSRPIPRR
jgi:hypothetical protein